MVVSSLTPRICGEMRCHCPGASLLEAAQRASRMTPHSSGSLGGVEVGHLAGLLELEALVDEQRRVAAVVDDQVRARRRPATRAPRSCTTSTPRASRPSRRRRRCPSGSARCRRGRPRPPRRRVSCVLKMLHETQRTSAPRSTSVSISTAVCTVMCSEPMIRAPASGLLPRVARAQRHQAGHLLLGEADLLAPELGEARGPSL